ncbi:MAG: hypothetical protein AAFQ82_11425, partial [Myxococcota bacterium]
MRKLVAIALTVSVCGCDKVGLTEVSAFFSVSEATWFESEQTLFFFYQLDADQGLDARSVIEVRYDTDSERVNWTAIISKSTSASGSSESGCSA